MAVSSMRLDSRQAQPIADVTEIAILTAYQHNMICVSKQRRSRSLQHCSVRIIKVSVIWRAIATTEPLIGFPTDVVTEVLELGQSRIAQPQTGAFHSGVGGQPGNRHLLCSKLF